LTINFTKTNHTTPFTDWLTKTLQNVDTETMEHIITIIYRIWQARNLLVFQEKNVPVNQVIQQAQINAKEIRTLNRPIHNASKHAATLAVTTITGNLCSKAF
jgi:hypothetical protein